MNILKGYRVFVALTCLALLLALGMGSARASLTRQGEVDFVALDAYIETQRQALGIPGLSLALVQGEQVIHLQGFGVADSSGRKVTPQTPFYIASVSKPFTALAVMQLVEAGKIDLDAPVQTYLPWFELADKEASARITVRNLLNHTTGIATFDNDRYELGQKGLEETVRGFTNLRPTQPVGTVFQYCSLNYSIAGLVVEKVSGQSYGDYVAQHIFEPLDMRHSYAAHASALADGLAEGHYYMFGHAFSRIRPWPAAGLPAGGLSASAEDLAHFAIANLNGGRYGDTAILSPQGVAEQHAPAIPSGEQGDSDSFGLGWAMSTLDGLSLVGHAGDLGNFHSDLFLLPEKDWGVVLLANASGFEQLNQLEGITRGVIDMLNGKSPASVKLPFLSRFLYWTILLMPFLQLLGIVFTGRYWRDKKGVGHLLVTVILYGAVAYLWLVSVPQMITSPILPGLVFFFPELAFGLIMGAALGIGWSVIFTALNLRARTRSTS